jgi:hypothetical protein
LASKKKRTKEAAASEKNTTASTDKEEDTTEQGTSTEAIQHESKVMFCEKDPDANFWGISGRKPLENTSLSICCVPYYTVGCRNADMH